MFTVKLTDRRSVTLNSQDTSITKSTQLDAAVPASKIAKLSSGEFVGLVADDPDNKIDLKVFHNAIINDHEAIKAEEEGYQALPAIRHVGSDELSKNYYAIKSDIEQMIDRELAVRDAADD